MNHYISLLRGINVSGQKMIKMAELVELYESLGFRNVKTYMQSGNVVFESTTNDAIKVSKKLEQNISSHFGFHASVFILTPADIKQVISKNPFLKRKGIDENRLYVSFLSEKPGTALVKNIDVKKDASEEFRIIDRAVYLYLPNGFGRAKLQVGVFEKKLNVTATARNWKTVNALNKIVGDT